MPKIARTSSWRERRARRILNPQNSNFALQVEKKYSLAAPQARKTNWCFLQDFSKNKFLKSCATKKSNVVVKGVGKSSKFCETSLGLEQDLF